MKKIWRQVSALLLTLLLLAAMPTAAFAAGSAVTFRGMEQGIQFEKGSGYTSTDLFGNFKNLMPGDVLVENISIKNAATDCDSMKIYLKAIAHSESSNPLSYSEMFENSDGKDQTEIVGVRDETVPTMQDFLGQLDMRVYNGTTEIYHSSPDRAGALVEPIYLGTLKRGESLQLRVVLSVPVTLDNGYANRVGEVDWLFTAEAFDDGPMLIQTGQLNWPIPVLGGLGLLLVIDGLLMLGKKRREDSV